jgi:hypothetical protein
MSIPEYATCKKCGDSVRGYTYCDGRHCGRSGYRWKTPVLEKK